MGQSLFKSRTGRVCSGAGKSGVLLVGHCLFGFTVFPVVRDPALYVFGKRVRTLQRLVHKPHGCRRETKPAVPQHREAVPAVNRVVWCLPAGVEAQRATQAERSRSLARDRQPNKKEKRSLPETQEEGLDLGSEVNVVLAPLVSGGRELSRALVAAGKEEEG